MNAIYRALRQGPLLIAEVRGFKSEIGKKFDKSNKDAPPITFGVFKIHLELLGDGTPVMLSIYPGASTDLDTLGQRLQLRRGAIVAVSIGKQDIKDGQRRVVCAVNAVRILEEEEVRVFLAA